MIPIIGLYLWAVRKQGVHENNHWASALGMPLVPLDSPRWDLDRRREAMLRICVASGYTTASEFLAGAEKAFLHLTMSALNGDLQNDAGLASPSARSRIDDCLGIYSGEMAGYAEIVDAREVRHRGCVHVRFGRPGVHQGVEEQPKDWREARRRVRTATQIWIFERDLRSADPNWFLSEIHDPIEA
jgi:hypothetical protein